MAAETLREMSSRDQQLAATEELWMMELADAKGMRYTTLIQMGCREYTLERARAIVMRAQRELATPTRASSGRLPGA